MTTPKTDGRARFDAYRGITNQPASARLDRDSLERIASRTYLDGDPLTAADRAALIDEVRRFDARLEIPRDAHDVYLAGIVLGAWRREVRLDATSPARDHEDAAKRAMQHDTTNAWKRGR